MEANQKILYEHFKKLSVDGKTDKIRDDAKKRAAGLLAEYPRFEVQKEIPQFEVQKEIKSDSKPKVKEK